MVHENVLLFDGVLHGVYSNPSGHAHRIADRFGIPDLVR